MAESIPAVTAAKMFLCNQVVVSEGEFSLTVLVIELSLKFVLDHLPAFSGVGDYAPGTVLETCRQDAEITRTGKKKERAVAEQA